MAKENKMEKTNTTITKRWSSDLSVQETLFFNSSNESLMYEIMFYLYFLHGLRGSNSRHLVLETSALPTELNPFLFNIKGIRFVGTLLGHFKNILLIQYLSYLTRPNSSSSFTNSEAKTNI